MLKSYSGHIAKDGQKAKVAFITGGNGITGNALMDYLLEETKSQEWSKIVVTSNSALASKVQDPRLVFIALDFTKDVKELIQLMQKECSETTHTYFSSYIHKDDFQELNKANQDLFENYLTAITTVAPKLENVTLQTGGKYYNVHLQPAPSPVREDQPRDEKHAHNFYYAQEDYLKESQKGSNWSWNVIRPQAIIGSTYKPNGMNTALTLALYFSICKELNTKAPMPTNQRFWEGSDDLSYAPLIADLSLFVSTHSNCANEAFNCTNGDTVRWQYLWPRLASYFGIKPEDAMDMSCTQYPAEGSLEQTFTMDSWANGKRETWAELCDKKGSPGCKSTFDCGTWQFQDWVFRRSWSALLSASKAREYGWTGYIDTYNSFIFTFEQFVERGIIPKPEKAL